MSASPVPTKVAVAAASVIVISIVLVGYFVVQQILLSVYVAVLVSLILGLLYVAWQYVGSAER